jgi:hypothetical protein
MRLPRKSGRRLAVVLGTAVAGCSLGPAVDIPAPVNTPDGKAAPATSTASVGADAGEEGGVSSATGTPIVIGGSAPTYLGGVASGSSSSTGASSSASTSAGSPSPDTSSSSSSMACSPVPTDGGVQLNTPVECTSGKTYMSGFGPTMEPGYSCYNCHGLQFTVGGTVYPTAHEPDYCDGVDVQSATVVLTDAQNNKIELTPNSVGNFYSAQTVVMPFTAVVSYQGKSNAMTTPQTNADCNFCHTQEGANCAPGRIVLP